MMRQMRYSKSGGWWTGGWWAVADTRLRRAGVGIREDYAYCAAAICLLAAAAALRFYELGLPLAAIDEVAVSNNSGGTLAEVVSNTRANNSSPLLYPLLLWAVQQIDISPFSIRLLPALAGVLTVGVILALPRFGVRWEAALLAAVLAALAPAAILEARGAREYGIDALVTALLIAGLLWYRQDGRKGLLRGALLAAPLLQYGLVLFGVATLGAGLLLPPAYPVGLVKADWSRREWIRDWVRRRVGLAGPAAFFLAGCGVSYLTTLRYQLEIAGPGFTLTNYHEKLYFRDEYQIVPVLEFIIASVWNVVSHHLPLAVIIAVAVALAIGLLSAGARRRDRGRDGVAAEVKDSGGQWVLIGTLFMLALAVAVGAALWGQYPASATRHITYLGPAVFVFSGVALATAIAGLAQSVHWPAGASRGCAGYWLAAMLGRERLGVVLTAVAAAVLGCAGVLAIWQSDVYRIGKAADYFAVLEQSVQEDDIVYSTWLARQVMSFYSAYYGRDWPDNYIIDTRNCGPGYTECVMEPSHITAVRGEGYDVWMINDLNITSVLARYDARGYIDGLVRFRHGGNKPAPRLYLLRFPAFSKPLDRERREWLKEYRPLLSGEPVWRGNFDVYYNDNRLIYAREPCAPADVAARFFLHIVPAGPARVLPEDWQAHGFENRDFSFADGAGAPAGNRCLITVKLPDYDIAMIHTGQYAGARRLWQADIPTPGADRFDANRAAEIAGREPAARAIFNLYLDGNSLLYAKEPCAPADTDFPFFLHITPADPQVLPEPQRAYGFDNRDFSFDPDGVRFEGQCYISRPLPQYEIAGIRTGQYDGNRRIWQAEFAP